MNDGGSAASRRVFLHVGSPKTGTTFLQQVLWSQQQKAAEQGLLLPLDRFQDHFFASLDIRGLSHRPEHPNRAVGIWERLVDEVAAWPGDALVSHELFAAASAEQAARVVSSFGPDREVHVVLTARDLVRQIPAEWQEHVKHRSTKTLTDFVADLRADTERTGWFWQVQDFADIAERWGRRLPPSRVHVVTVPPPGTDPTILWTRFASLLGLDPASFDTEVTHANTSLGVEQVELLRRVNAALGDRVRLPGPYPVVAKNVLAHRILAARPGTRLTLDAATSTYAVQRSVEIAERLSAGGFDVVGDLAELVPSVAEPTTDGTTGPAPAPDADVLLTEAVAALAGLLDALAQRGAQRRYEDLVKDLKRAPVRFVLLRASERHPALMRLRRVYRTRRASTR